jgi:acyl-phosphate glycerol 3-phosphate acyltransferase
MLATSLPAEVSLILGAYLYGSIPFVWAMARLRRINLRRHGSKSISGSNLWQATGALEGIVAGFGDFTKGIVPVVVGYSLGFDLTIICIAGIAAVAGQCWPIFLKFFGGRGGSSACGLAIALAPHQFLIAAIPFIVGLLWRNIPLLFTPGDSPAKERLRFRGKFSDIVPIGMLATFALLPLIAWLGGQPKVITVAFSALLCLLIIRRLTADLHKDLNEAPDRKAVVTILVNRLIYDRSHRSGY